MTRTRNRTPKEDIAFGLYLYFLGLSFRNASKALSCRIIKISHVSIWKWVQKYKPQKVSQKKIKISEFIIDETLLKIGKQFVWVWITIDELTKVILGIRIYFERIMLVAEQFLKGLVKRYGKYKVSTDGSTWYPQSCGFLRTEPTYIHHLKRAL